MPADRVLAAFRGERDKQLRIRIALDADRLKQRIARQLSRRAAPACREWLAGAVDDAWARLLWPKVQVDIRRTLRERSELASIEVFARNLEALLMQPPLGPLAVLGIDPGYRTGCKVAAIDGTGRFLDSATVYPTPPRKDVAGAVECVGELARRAGAKGLAVGNGTGGRETLQALGAVGLPVHLVNEAGASVYSASAVARREFPDLDLTIRGAISIGRRLQDPLAELVKIEPRSIGVGQYQHDVDQTLLGQALDRVVERVVNRVGVHLNTASVELLCHVSGLNRTLAEKIVAHRDQHGPFRDRGCLLGVTGLGPRTFEQAAGFMRIPEGGEPLDSTGIHPESYPVVREIARAAGCRPADLVGSAQRLIGLDPQDFVTSAAGLPTVEDIFEELARPGRDPRGEARQQAFDERVRSIEDLEQGQELPGVVTNVAQFGAFVDIGVKKDGLIHVSSLSRPVSIGEWMRVRVTQIDSERQRISLVPV